MVDSIAFAGRGYARQGQRGRPVFTSVDYSLGDPDGGGQPITIRGKCLFNASVNLDGTPCHVLSSTNDTCKFTLPPGTAGVVSLSITTRDGSANIPNAFEYWSPSVTALDYFDSSKGLSFTSTNDDPYGVTAATSDIHSSSFKDAQRNVYNAPGEGSYSEYGQSFTGNGACLALATFFLKKAGTPSGNMYARLYSLETGIAYGAGGTAVDLLATSDPIDVSTLGFDFVDVDFTFSGAEQYYLEDGRHYCIVFANENGGSGNKALIGVDTSKGHTGNSVANTFGFGTDSNVDCCFKVTTVPATTDFNKWIDQTAGYAYSQDVPANRPTHVQNVFGTMPAVRFVPQNFLTGTFQDMGATGMSVFAVAKWTSSDSTIDGDATNVPLTIIGSSQMDGAFGPNAGQLEVNYWDGFGSVIHVVDRGSGLNDGVTRLIGVTYDTVTETKFYVGDVQQGSTDVGTAVLGSAGFDTIGAGVAGLDGFDGDIGAVIIYDTVPISSIVSYLNRWARQRFGTP